MNTNREDLCLKEEGKYAVSGVRDITTSSCDTLPRLVIAVLHPPPGDLVRKRRFSAGVFDDKRHCEESSTKQSTFTDCSSLRLFGSGQVDCHVARGLAPRNDEKEGIALGGPDKRLCGRRRHSAAGPQPKQRGILTQRRGGRRDSRRKGRCNPFTMQLHTLCVPLRSLRSLR